MTRVPVGGRLETVTLLEIVPQEVLRTKTKEKDWYEAVVVGYGKKEKTHKKGKVVSTYRCVREFSIDSSYESVASGEISYNSLQPETLLTIVGTSKGKWFQWPMKRCHTDGGPKTHGSKFHRAVWSMGNRKPRRVMKGHPHAGHMWDERITVKHVKLIDMLDDWWEKICIVKGSIPGHYNAFVCIGIEK